MFQTVRFVEEEAIPGRIAPVPTEFEIGRYSSEHLAVAAARASMAEFFASRRPEYAWWIVRQDGQQLANWIADSRTGREFVVDLTTSRLVEVA
ncbi:MAG: hypothetical protein OEM84_06885 [Acidimicrobiia bacterium]|nr:hypothetical protein [Acidimicrobiia bacterium]